METLPNQLSPMKTGKDLLSEMTVLPKQDPDIRLQPSTVRLMALSDLYDIYLPSSMSVEIYNKLYLALLRSLQKKEGPIAQIQRNENHKRITQKENNSILGGPNHDEVEHFFPVPVLPLQSHLLRFHSDRPHPYSYK